MTLPHIVGRLLAAAGALAIWLAALGAFVPPLDALASFLPMFLAVMAAGLALARLWRRGGWIAGALLTLIPAIHAIGYEAMRSIPAAPESGERINVLTHNLYARNRDLPATANAIAQAGADIVLLQEVMLDEFRLVLALDWHEHSNDVAEQMAAALRHAVQEQGLG